MAKDSPNNTPNERGRRGLSKSKKGRHANLDTLAFLARTPTRKRFPHSTLYECLKSLFAHASVFKAHRHAVYHCLEEVQKPFRHASVFETRVSTRACPFFKRAFSPIYAQNDGVGGELLLGPGLVSWAWRFPTLFLHLWWTRRPVKSIAVAPSEYSEELHINFLLPFGKVPVKDAKQKEGKDMRDNSRRTNVQQLMCKMVWSFSFII